MRGKKVVSTFVLVFLVFSGYAGSQAAVQEENPGVARTGNPAALHRVFIGFRSLPSAAEEALVRARGGAIKYTYHLVPAIAATIPEAAINALLRNPNVTGIDPDGLVFAIDAELDNAWGVQRINAGIVHELGNTGQGVKVAVIDSGIDYNHPDLAPNYAGGYDFIYKDNDPMDYNGHGTHVAGTIAAADDGFGVVGVAPGASIYALRVLDASGYGNWSDVIAALEWAVDNGIQVTNHSYGSSGNPGGTVKKAFDNADAAGLLNVAAAGNDGNCGGVGDRVDYPARYDSVISVGAVDEQDQRPCFSSTGDTLELTAPGVNINSTWPGGAYVSWNGTSMASPHVAGTAALIIASGITDNYSVRQILIETADDLGDPGLDPQYGFGLVNAESAVEAATYSPPQTPPPTGATTASVVSIDYATEGGRNNNKNLLIIVAIADDLGNPTAGAMVSIDLYRDGRNIFSGAGTTGSDGTVIFTLRNARSGCYSTIVTDVIAGDLTWDGTTPGNQFCKSR